MDLSHKLRCVTPTILSVEGLIGSGKSSLISTLRNSRLALKYALFVVEEPTLLWQNVFGYNLLKLYYENMERFAYTFQSLCLATRFDEFKKYLHQSHNIDDRPIIIIMERSWESDYYCFSKLHHKNGHIHTVQLEMLKKQMQDGLNAVPTIDGIIMLEVPVSTTMKRISARGRCGEINYVNSTYQEQIRDQYNQWLQTSNIPHIKINGNVAFHTQPASPISVENIVIAIEQFVSDIIIMKSMLQPPMVGDHQHQLVNNQSISDSENDDSDEKKVLINFSEKSTNIRLNNLAMPSLTLPPLHANPTMSAMAKDGTTFLSSLKFERFSDDETTGVTDILWRRCNDSEDSSGTSDGESVEESGDT